MMSIFHYVIKIKLKGRFFIENFYTNRQCLLSLFVKVVFLSNEAFGSVSRNKLDSSRPKFLQFICKSPFRYQQLSLKKKRSMELEMIKL